MKPFPVPVLTTQSSSLTEAGRALLDEEGITLETRGLVGGYRPWQRVYWEEVTGIYTWEAPDWNVITIGILVALLSFFAGAALLTMRSDLAAILFWVVLGVIAVGAGWWVGVRLQPRHWFRLEAGEAAVQFHTRRSDVWALLQERLKIAGDVRECPPSDESLG